MKASAALAAILGMGLSAPAHAQWQARGQVGIESRAFQGDERVATEDYGVGLAGRVELDHQHGVWRESVRLFGRFDQLDAGRNALVVEEAWVGLERDPWRVRAGFQLLTWTATEGFHPADVINSRNFESPLENMEKLGEPMLSLWYRLGSGSASAYYMPAYVPPLLPSTSSRLSFVPPGTKLGKALWLERDGSFSSDKYGHQWAARVTQSIGKGDVAVQVAQHQDRHQPTFVIDPTQASLRPLYQAVTLVGGTYSQVLGPAVAKVEVASRNFSRPRDSLTPYGEIPDPDHTLVALGLEYGWTHDNGSDSTVIVEGQSLIGLSREERVRQDFFQRDILLGYRLAVNDERGKELLVSVIVDLDRRREVLVNLSYNQRLGEHWSVKSGLRIIDAPLTAGPPAGLQLLHDSNHVYLSLVRYF